MNCPDVEKQIVEGAPLTGEAGLHLLNCRQCQRFARAAGLALYAGRVQSPSRSLDDQVLNACHARQRDGGRLPGVLRMAPRLAVLYRVLAPIAAVVLLVLGVWLAISSHAIWLQHREQFAQRNETMRQVIVFDPVSLEDQWNLVWTEADDELENLEWQVSNLELDSIPVQKMHGLSSLSYDINMMEYNLYGM
ncbi:MAG: hypothetical protein IJJ33_08630 [Victivallales bacterium]|nr:hypothetical protein [Victivallales bacterium]